MSISITYEVVARIALPDEPTVRNVAVTPDQRLGAATVRSVGKVVLFDPIALQLIDTDPSSADVDLLDLPPGASPFWVVATRDYAYVSDANFPVVYAINLRQTSSDYLEITTIPLTASDVPAGGSSSVDITPDGKRLFVAAPNRRLGGRRR